MSTLFRALPLVLAIVACGPEPIAVDGASTPRASSPSEEPTTRPASFAMVKVVLYQHENLAAERTGSAEELGAFLKAVERTIAASLPVGSTPRELDVVIAIKPGRRARFWFVQDPAGESMSPQLEQELQALEAPRVSGGPVAVALIGSIAGAPTTSKRGAAPIPREWRDELDQQGPSGPLPEAVLATLWPD